MSPENAVKWSTRFIFVGLAVFFAGSLILAYKYNIDPIGYKVGTPAFPMILYLIIWFILYILILHIVGKIFKIDYFLFRFDSAFTVETWKKASLWGKFVILLIIPELLYLGYLVIRDDPLVSRIWFLPFLHTTLIYSVFGKNIKQNYRKLYGKEAGDKLYTASQQPYHAADRLFNFRFWLVVLIINPLEMILILGALSQIKSLTLDDILLVALPLLLVVLIVQDFIVLHFLSKPKSKAS